MQSDQLFTGIMKSFFYSIWYAYYVFQNVLVCVWDGPNPSIIISRSCNTHTHTQNEITLLLLNKEKHRNLWVRIWIDPNSNLAPRHRGIKQMNQSGDSAMNIVKTPFTDTRLI